MTQLVGMVSSEYTRLLIVAWVIAAPIAFLGGRMWMRSFAYQVDLGVWPYLAAGITTLVLAWITVSYQSIKAARVNPIETLRYE